MSGEELKNKLKGEGISQIEIARLLGVSQQSVNQSLDAKDIKSGFLEDLCRVLGKDMSFFYNISFKPVNNDEEETFAGMRKAIEQLQQENSTLKVELARLKNLKLPTKDSKVYNLWMKFMDITSEMQELYKEEKGE